MHYEFLYESKFHSRDSLIGSKLEASRQLLNYLRDDMKLKVPSGTRFIVKLPKEDISEGV